MLVKESKGYGTAAITCDISIREGCLDKFKSEFIVDLQDQSIFFCSIQDPRYLYFQKFILVQLLGMAGSPNSVKPYTVAGVPLGLSNSSLFTVAINTSWTPRSEALHPYHMCLIFLHI